MRDLWSSKSSRGEVADRQIVFVCSELLPTIRFGTIRDCRPSSIPRSQSGKLAISD